MRIWWPRPADSAYVLRNYVGGAPALFVIETDSPLRTSEGSAVLLHLWAVNPLSLRMCLMLVVEPQRKLALSLVNVLRHGREDRKLATKNCYQISILSNLYAITIVAI
jgi:hypothetical protein